MYAVVVKFVAHVNGREGLPAPVPQEAMHPLEKGDPIRGFALHLEQPSLPRDADVRRRRALPVDERSSATCTSGRVELLPPRSARAEPVVDLAVRRFVAPLPAQTEVADTAAEQQGELRVETGRCNGRTCTA